MLNSECVAEALPDKAMRNIHGHLKKKMPEYVEEYENQIEMIKQRQIAFWKEREAERVDMNDHGGKK